MRTDSGNTRRDAILILPSIRAAIQCELKHFWKYDDTLRDIERVQNAAHLDQFLQDGGADDDVLSYARYGMYLGFGHVHNTCGAWWRSGENKEARIYAETNLREDEKSTLDVMGNIYKTDNAIVGIKFDEGSNLPIGKQFWLAYFLQELQR